MHNALHTYALGHSKASQERVITQVTKTNGEVSKFKYITFEGSNFYGVTTKSGELIKTPLSQEELAQVLTKNKTASTWATVALIAIPAIAIAVVISTIDFYPDTSIDWTE